MNQSIRRSETRREFALDRSDLLAYLRHQGIHLPDAEVRIETFDGLFSISRKPFTGNLIVSIPVREDGTTPVPHLPESPGVIAQRVDAWLREYSILPERTLVPLEVGSGIHHDLVRLLQQLTNPGGR